MPHRDDDGDCRCHCRCRRAPPSYCAVRDPPARYIYIGTISLVVAMGEFHREMEGTESNAEERGKTPTLKTVPLPEADVGGNTSGEVVEEVAVP